MSRVAFSEPCSLPILDSTETLADPPTPVAERSNVELANMSENASFGLSTIEAVNQVHGPAQNMLDMDSLLTFFCVLQVTDSGKTTRLAAVTAFHALVNFERKKRGNTLLPISCIARLMVESKIIPHTIRLGTTSVAGFLDKLEFDINDETDVAELDCAWERLSRNKARED